jgi:hypothetical protein
MATAPFKAIINNQGQFEIQDQADKKVHFDSLSLISPQSQNSKGQVLRVLAHLARFHEIENIGHTHEDKSLREAIDIKLCRISGVPILDAGAGFIEVRDGGTLVLSVANKYEPKAYVHIFYLTPTWEIVDLS